MTLWLDNHLPPSLATWVRAVLGVECTSVRDLALQRAADLDILQAAREASALVMTKDADFAALVNQFGPPPQIVLVTCGNTSNASLRQILSTPRWPQVPKQSRPSASETTRIPDNRPGDPPEKPQYWVVSTPSQESLKYASR